MQRIITICFVIALSCTGCAASTDETQKPRLRVIPISSIVRPIKSVDEGLDWETVVQGHLTGQPVYDTVFRRPTGPVSPVVAYCDKTRSLGIYIEVDTENLERVVQRPLRFTWSHMQSPNDEPARSTFRQAWFMPRVQGVLVYSDTMSLSKERRIDGEWEVAVFYLGEEVYRESFMLMDCDKPYAPDWFEDDES